MIQNSDSKLRIHQLLVLQETPPLVYILTLASDVAKVSDLMMWTFAFGKNGMCSRKFGQLATTSKQLMPKLYIYHVCICVYIYMYTICVYISRSNADNIYVLHMWENNITT